MCHAIEARLFKRAAIDPTRTSAFQTPTGGSCINDSRTSRPTNVG